MNNPTFHLKKLEKEEQTKPKQTWEGKCYDRVDLNEVGSSKAIEKNQWYQKLVLWKDTQYWQTFS